MRDAEVTKEYKEELGERDADGFYDYAYRFWEYSFDFGDRRYRARIYTDDPGVASITGPTRWEDAPTNPELHAIARHLEQDAGPVEIHILGPSGGYDRVRLVSAPES